MAKQFFLLALGIVQIVISKIGKCLPEPPFSLVPITFELELIHDLVRNGVRSMSEEIELPDRYRSESRHLSRQNPSAFSMDTKLVLDRSSRAN